MILDAIYPSDARVTNECEELIKNGHEIYLFCLSYQKNYIKSETIKMPQNAVSEFVVTSANINTSKRIPKKALKGCCKGNVIG